MYDLIRRFLKTVVLPALDLLIRILPKPLRVLLLVGVADSLGLKNARFDVPMRLSNDRNAEPHYINLGLFPGDRSVIPSILISGRWELSEPCFVVDHMKPGTHYTLIDVGANFGLFTLQVMGLLDQAGGENPIARVKLFEPDPSIAPILRRNVQALTDQGVDIEVIEKALGTEAGTATFYLDNANKANNSLAPRAMARATSGVTEVEVEVMAAADIPALASGAKGERIIYKSDLQGIDPQIAAAIPMEFWDRVDVFIVELWPQVLKDYTFFTDVFEKVCASFDVIILEEHGTTRQIQATELPGIIAGARDHQYFNLLCHRV
jgi:FkbM family methyltransferase